MTKICCESLMSAATKGHIHCLASHVKRQEQGADQMFLFSSALNKAVEHHQLECIEFLHHAGVPWSALSMELAALSGDINVIKYMYDHGALWDEFTTAWAIHKNSVEILRFAHAHGAPFSPILTALAACGRLECLVYAHEHGAVWHDLTMHNAFSGGHFDCLQYAKEHGCPWDAQLQLPMHFAHRRVDRDCMKYAHKCGSKWNQHTTTSAAKFNQSDCLQFMIERGCNYAALDKDIQRHRDVVLHALKRCRSSIIIQRAWRAAREAAMRKAVSVVEDAYIAWTCRPGAGRWYKRSYESFMKTQSTQ